MEFIIVGIFIFLMGIVAGLWIGSALHWANMKNIPDWDYHDG